MSGNAVEDNKGLSLRIEPRDRATLLRASALARTDMADFIVRQALRAAHELIEGTEHVVLSQHDSKRVLALLEDPPSPNARVRSAAEALPSAE
jgi:uncharacterized protein (DUF1778 family)